MRPSLRTRLAALPAAATFCASAAAWGQALPPELPLRRQAQESASGVSWTPALVLLGLAGAAGGYLAWRRGAGKGQRGMARRGESALARVSSQALTPQATVHVVQWNGSEYLVGCTAQQVTLLARRPLEAGAQEGA